MLKVEPLRYGITLSGNKSDTQQMWTIISESDQRVNTKDLRNEQLPVNFINWHWKKNKWEKDIKCDANNSRKSEWFDSDSE